MGVEGAVDPVSSGAGGSGEWGRGAVVVEAKVMSQMVHRKVVLEEEEGGGGVRFAVEPLLALIFPGFEWEDGPV